MENGLWPFHCARQFLGTASELMIQMGQGAVSGPAAGASGMDVSSIGRADPILCLVTKSLLAPLLGVEVSSHSVSVSEDEVFFFFFLKKTPNVNLL